MLKIVIQLPQKFEIFVRSIQQEIVMPTLENLGAHLHLEESNMKLRVGNLTKEALVMRIKHVVRNNHIWGRFSNFVSGRTSNPMQHKGNSNVLQQITRQYDQSRGIANWQEFKYYRCSKSSHTFRYCLASSSIVQQPPKSEMGAYIEELTSDLDDETIQVELKALALEEDHEWIIDLGASRHFLGNVQVFSSIKPSSLGRTGVPARSHNHPIQGQGSINLSSSNGEIKRISFVYHILGLNRNLLSIAK